MHKQWQKISIFNMVHFVHHKVSVSTHDQREFVGWVYTVDPVTQSIVIYLNGQLTTIMGHSISEVVSLETPTPAMKRTLGSLLEEDHPCENEWLLQRKTSLAQWLHDNRFPVQVKGDRIIVGGVLDIVPPYNINSCHTSNEIILGRVQRIIESLPELPRA